MNRDSKDIAHLSESFAVGDIPRTTDSPMVMPTFSRTMQLMSRALRLRCPNCGAAPVLERCQSFKTWGAVRTRCSGCNFRFERTDDGYFSGALITNLFMSEALFAVAFAAAVISFWPNVPWDGLTIVAAAGMVVAPALLYPVAKVVWLTVDVLVRPVTESEVF